MTKNKMGVLLIICILMGTVAEQKCSKVPSKEILPSISEIMRKQPDELSAFVRTYKDANPWAVLGLTEGAPKDAINSAFNLISYPFRNKKNSVTQLYATDVARELFSMLEKVRNNLLVLADKPKTHPALSATQTLSAVRTKPSTSKSKLPASSKEILPSISELMRKKPTDLFFFIERHKNKNPWAVFGLTEGAPNDAINSAFNLLSSPFQEETIAKDTSLTEDDKEHRKKLYEILEAARNDLIARADKPTPQPVQTSSALSTAPQVPAPQANNPFSKVPKAKVPIRIPEKVTPEIFYSKVLQAYDSDNPWAIFGVTKDVDPAVVHEIFERFTAWYAPENIYTNTASSAQDKKIAGLLYDLLKKLRDKILIKEKDIEEPPIVEPPQPKGFIDIIPIYQNSPSQLYKLIQEVGASTPWVIFGIDQDANIATINAAFNKLARKFSPYVIENYPDSTAEDKKIAAELFEKLMELRRKMFETAREREAKEHSHEQQRQQTAMKQKPYNPARTIQASQASSNSVGYIKQITMKPSDFLVTIETDAAANEPWEALGVSKTANKLTIETAFARLKEQFDPKKIKAAPQSSTLDRNAADRIVPLLTRMRDEMLQALGQ